VTEEEFTVSVIDIGPILLQLMDHYGRRVFDLKALFPKVIHGRPWQHQNLLLSTWRRTPNCLLADAPCMDRGECHIQHVHGSDCWLVYYGR
jgi:hypothetical protein